MQSIKALQKFIYVITDGVIQNDKFRDIHVYNTDNISILDDMVIDDEFYQSNFKTNTNDGILSLNLNTIELCDLEFCVRHKIIKCLTDCDDNQTLKYSNYYIGNLYYKKTNGSYIYGVDDHGKILFNNIAVKTTLNDTKTSETIVKIIALNSNNILLDLIIQ